jgi:hypothetical protein
VTSPSALLFVDALGETIPFKRTFTFKELSDFCRREGVMHLAGSDKLTGDELLSIADKINTVTNGHIRVAPEPLKKTGNRFPLSKIDMEIAHQVTGSTCRKCEAQTDHRLYCDSCREKTADILFGAPGPQRSRRKPWMRPVDPETGKPQDLGKPQASNRIDVGARVLLSEGTQVHVVDKYSSRIVGVDDDFLVYHFTTKDAVEVHNLDDPIIEKTASESCPICGEEMYDYDKKCRVCKYHRDVPSDKWEEGKIDWGGMGD